MLQDECNTNIVSALQRHIFSLSVNKDILEMILCQWLYGCNWKRQDYVYGKWDNNIICQKIKHYLKRERNQEKQTKNMI